MGLCFRAGMHLIASDQSQQSQLKNISKRLQKLKHNANQRELGHSKAIEQWLLGNWYSASQIYADILHDFPRDLTALLFGHQIDYLLGQPQSSCNRCARVIDHWSDQDTDSSFVYGMLAFSLEESGHFSKAQAMAEHCIAINPKDVWGIHALVHCYEMQGKTAQGINFLEGSAKNWSAGNYLSVHIHWHFCLYLMERGDFQQALRIFDQHFLVSKDSELLYMHDSVALLWRLSLFGFDVGNRWENVAQCYVQYIEQAYMPFNDMHAIMAFLMSGRVQEARILISVLEFQAEQDSTRSMIIRLAGLPILKSIMAFCDGDYSNAKRLLNHTIPLAHLMGGSVAQRDILNFTLIVAAKRSNDQNMLKGLISERKLFKPSSPLIMLLNDLTN